MLSRIFLSNLERRDARKPLGFCCGSNHGAPGKIDRGDAGESGCHIHHFLDVSFALLGKSEPRGSVRAIPSLGRLQEHET